MRIITTLLLLTSVLYSITTIATDTTQSQVFVELENRPICDTSNSVDPAALDNPNCVPPSVEVLLGPIPPYEGEMTPPHVVIEQILEAEKQDALAKQRAR